MSTKTTSPIGVRFPRGVGRNVWPKTDSPGGLGASGGQGNGTELAEDNCHSFGRVADVSQRERIRVLGWFRFVSFRGLCLCTYFKALTLHPWYCSWA